MVTLALPLPDCTAMPNPALFTNVPPAVVILKAPEPGIPLRKIAAPVDAVAVTLPPVRNTVWLPLNWSELPNGMPR